MGTWRFLTIRVAGAVLVNLWALLTPVRGRAARTPPWRASQSTCRCSDSWRGWSAGKLGHAEKAPKRGVADAVLTVRTGGTRRRAQRGPWPCPAVRPASRLVKTPLSGSFGLWPSHWVRFQMKKFYWLQRRLSDKAEYTALSVAE